MKLKSNCLRIVQWSKHSVLLFCITCHPFIRLLFIYIHFFFCTVLISSVIDMSCQLFVRVSDQHESLCYFGHGAHFISAMYCYISFLFLIDVISIIVLML